MKKLKLSVFVTVLAASVLATAAFASTNTSTIALKSTAVGKVLVGANGRRSPEEVAAKRKRVPR